METIRGIYVNVPMLPLAPELLISHFCRRDFGLNLNGGRHPDGAPPLIQIYRETEGGAVSEGFPESINHQLSSSRFTLMCYVGE